MPAPDAFGAGLVALGLLTAAPTFAQHGKGHMPSSANRPSHEESARQDESEPLAIETPPLPEGMSLDDVLDRADRPPPDNFPDPLFDDELRAFTLIEQAEYRVRDGVDLLGWDAQGWGGYDYHKLWWKSEGEAAFEGSDEGESETDLLYARLVSPFWNAQAGVRYANRWQSGDYADTWSAAVALQGLAPGMFEVDLSFYVSEKGDVSAELETSYDLRLLQRLVLQPRAELTFLAQDVPEEMLGAGMPVADLDLRLRYELKREIAPYIGVRYRFLTGETADIAEDAGNDSSEPFFLVGLRLAF